MAVMIPAECDLTRRPVSEQIVFEAIKNNVSDEWTVFHSFDYLSRDLEYKLWDGEIDFLLYHPGYGILILEVKGGTISYREGQWFQEERPIDPVEQAKRNKYAVRKLLEDKLFKIIPLKFAHAVCFPSCSKQNFWPPEAQDIVVTKELLPHIERFSRQLLECTHLPENITGSISRTEIMNVLSPVFEYGTKLSERMEIENKQFFLLTEQQCVVLEVLEQFRRLQICGCAGSGKTIMAIKKAVRLAAQNKRVLLLCFNQLLAKKLKKAVKDHPLIEAAAFFDYCIELLKIPEEQIAQFSTDPRLYSKVLPEMLRTYLERTWLYYDAVIVDEGQDFTPQAWAVISLLPESDGHFYIFYDPDQNIYTKELQLPDFGLPPVILNRNCRNTKKIFEAVQPLQSTPGVIWENSPQGSEVRILRGDCRKNLQSELERLVNYEKISLNNVVILGAHSLKNTSIGENPQIGKFHIVSTPQVSAPNEVRYFTYMKYKGCESGIVILLDVDEEDPRWKSRCGMYTAMSRAVHDLIILHK
ncbi:MAG: NERD domain-containing protein [Lentisphaeria bacterium]|nr:NERD domain-containing protein [Lentisphaeria bacterium]